MVLSSCGVYQAVWKNGHNRSVFFVCFRTYWCWAWYGFPIFPVSAFGSQCSLSSPALMLILLPRLPEMIEVHMTSACAQSQFKKKQQLMQILLIQLIPVIQLFTRFIHPRWCRISSINTKSLKASFGWFWRMRFKQTRNRPRQDSCLLCSWSSPMFESHGWWGSEIARSNCNM